MKATIDLLRDRIHTLEKQTLADVCMMASIGRVLKDAGILAPVALGKLYKEASAMLDKQWGGKNDPDARERLNKVYDIITRDNT